MALYILHGLSPRYLTFITTFNMTQVRPSLRVLQNQLENFERMLLATKRAVQESVFQANSTNFTKNYGNHQSGSSYGKSQGQVKPSQWNFHQFLKEGGVAQKNKNS